MLEEAEWVLGPREPTHGPVSSTPQSPPAPQRPSERGRGGWVGGSGTPPFGHCGCVSCGDRDAPPAPLQPKIGVRFLDPLCTWSLGHSLALEAAMVLIDQCASV